MVRRAGLAAVAMLAGCGDNLRVDPEPPLSALAVRLVAELPAEGALALAIAPVGELFFAVARADRRGGMFCPECVEADPERCPAICRRSLIEVQLRRVDGETDPPHRVAEVFPRTADHAIGGVQLVVLDAQRVGVGWLECDNASCGSGPKQSCTARYAAVELGTGAVLEPRTLYQNQYGGLQLVHDPRARRLLAVTGTRHASAAGVRAAIYDETAERQIAAWAPLGGAFARAPSAAATDDGFLVVAEDRRPLEPASAEPCAESCDCPDPGQSDQQASGGVFALWPGVARAAEGIAPGRADEAAYVAREAIAVIDAGGRPIVATSQAPGGMAEVFEPVGGGAWRRRLAMPAPAATWLGALGDARHLAWLGSEPVFQASPTVERLVAGVVASEGETEDIDQRGALSDAVESRVLQAAPVPTAEGVTTTYLLRGLLDRGQWLRFEVLEVHAAW